MSEAKTYWRVEHDNDTGPSDEGFWEWWTVTDGNRSFDCDDKADAKWLCDLLNTLPQAAPQQRA